MPYGNGTGPGGMGSGTGRGLGPCGLGRAWHRGGRGGRGLFGAYRAPVTEREAVNDEIRALKARLAELERPEGGASEKGE